MTILRLNSYIGHSVLKLVPISELIKKNKLSEQEKKQLEIENKLMEFPFGNIFEPSTDEEIILYQNVNKILSYIRETLIKGTSETVHLRSSIEEAFIRNDISRERDSISQAMRLLSKICVELEGKGYFDILITDVTDLPGTYGYTIHKMSSPVHVDEPTIVEEAPINNPDMINVINFTQKFTKEGLPSLEDTKTFLKHVDHFENGEQLSLFFHTFKSQIYRVSQYGNNRELFNRICEFMRVKLGWVLQYKENGNWASIIKDFYGSRDENKNEVVNQSKPEKQSIFRSVVVVDSFFNELANGLPKEKTTKRLMKSIKKSKFDKKTMLSFLKDFNTEVEKTLPGLEFIREAKQHGLVCSIRNFIRISDTKSEELLRVFSEQVIKEVYHGK